MVRCWNCHRVPPKRTLWKPLEKPTCGQSWSAENQRSQIKNIAKRINYPWKSEHKALFVLWPAERSYRSVCSLIFVSVPDSVRSTEAVLTLACPCLVIAQLGRRKEIPIWSLRACCSLSVAGGLERRILPGLNDSKSKRMAWRGRN